MLEIRQNIKSKLYISGAQFENEKLDVTVWKMYVLLKFSSTLECTLHSGV